MNRVKLFTLQNAKTLSQLERTGRVINNRVYVQLHLGDISPLFLTKYDWLTRQVARRLPKPKDVSAPIWCAVSPRSCMTPDANSVVYCLEVPEDQILFFDNFKWDYVLNQIYLPKDTEDAEAYNRHLAEIGVESRFDFTKDLYRNAFPEEVERIVDSWTRIFDLDEWNPWNVCANLWEIREDWVTQVIHGGEAVDIPALEHCDEGVVLYDTRPMGFQQRVANDSWLVDPDQADNHAGAKPSLGTRTDSLDPMLSQQDIRTRFAVK